jgi:hypothetical protein
MSRCRASCVSSRVLVARKIDLLVPWPAARWSPWRMAWCCCWLHQAMELERGRRIAHARRITGDGARPAVLLPTALRGCRWEQLRENNRRFGGRGRDGRGRNVKFPNADLIKA